MLAISLPPTMYAPQVTAALAATDVVRASRSHKSVRFESEATLLFFERRLGMDTAPLDGAFPLGLGRLLASERHPIKPAPSPIHGKRPLLQPVPTETRKELLEGVATADEFAAVQAANEEVLTAMHQSKFALLAFNEDPPPRVAKRPSPVQQDENWDADADAPATKAPRREASVDVRRTACAVLGVDN